MLRVGQRYIAWSAFERAARLAERFSPDPALREFLSNHCRRRQQAIEETLLFHGEGTGYGTPWQRVSPPPPVETVARLRDRFDQQLAHGQAFQRDYQEYESSRIAEGSSIDDEQFFDAFYAGRESIASPIGPEEWFARIPRVRMAEYAFERRMAWGFMGAGLAAMAVALFSRLAR
jgi:hypothetical protein